MARGSTSAPYTALLAAAVCVAAAVCGGLWGLVRLRALVHPPGHRELALPADEVLELEAGPLQVLEVTGGAIRFEHALEARLEPVARGGAPVDLEPRDGLRIGSGTRALELRGVLEVPAPGAYRFVARTADGTRAPLGGPVVVSVGPPLPLGGPLWGTLGIWALSGLLLLLALGFAAWGLVARAAARRAAVA